MKRNNFSFPEGARTRIEAAKLQSGVPVSEIIRRAVDAYLKSMDI